MVGHHLVVDLAFQRIIRKQRANRGGISGLLPCTTSLTTFSLVVKVGNLSYILDQEKV